jgi:iduronate 2-sulfatase
MKRDLKLTTLVGCLLVSGLWVTTEAQNTDRSARFLLEAAAPLRVLQEEDPPNVLFIIVDDLNTALGSYLGSGARPHYATASTPNLDRLAAQGIRFENAFVQNPLCNPSRASILSGLRPDTVDVHATGTWPRHKIGDELRMLPEHFNDHGYFTGRVGKVGHNSFEHAVSWDESKFALSRDPSQLFHTPGYLPGDDLSQVRDNTWREGSENGMSRRDIFAGSASGRTLSLPLTWRATREAPPMTPDGTTATRIIQLMAENRDQPFFLAAGLHKPHQPWVGPAQFFDQHPVDEIVLPQTPAGDSDDIPAPGTWILDDDSAHTDLQKKQAIAAYHAMVTMADHHVGRILKGLDDLGLAESTIVVFTSDHGFQLNEHDGLWRKQFQFDESIRVPLIVRLPDGRGAGTTSNALVELVDLYPTLIELAALPSPMHDLEGLSFAPLLDEPDSPWKSAAFSQSRRMVGYGSTNNPLINEEGYDGRTIRTARYRYTEWTPLDTQRDTLVELYDLEQDPMEYVNIKDEPAHANLVTELSERLATGWQGELPPSSGN